MADNQAAIDEAAQIMAFLISLVGQWELDNLNTVAMAIAWLNKHAGPDVPLVDRVRRMMEAVAHG